MNQMRRLKTKQKIVMDALNNKTSIGGIVKMVYKNPPMHKKSRHKVMMIMFQLRKT